MNLYELYQTYVNEYHITITYEEFLSSTRQKVTMNKLLIILTVVYCIASAILIYGTFAYGF